MKIYRQKCKEKYTYCAPVLSRKELGIPHIKLYRYSLITKSLHSEGFRYNLRTMITSLTLASFRAYTNTCLELTPMTLITGVNGS